ncbi:MAG: hypothetical protein ACC707_18275 [Thiohalomonadales bacterium]
MSMVDIMFQVNSYLSNKQKNVFAADLSSLKNIYSVQFRRNNLISVAYNPEVISPAEILQYADNKGVNASSMWL